MTGIAGESDFQVFVEVKQALSVELKTVQDSLIGLLSAYLVFDISHPKWHSDVHSASCVQAQR